MDEIFRRNVLFGEGTIYVLPAARPKRSIPQS
jgi:hypothetical protein